MSEIKRVEHDKPAFRNMFSKAVIHNGTCYLSGMVPSDYSGDIKTQTKNLLQLIDDALVSVGSNKSKILSACVYLASIGDYTGMNEAWLEWVDANNLPTRTTVEARLAHPNIKIEITVVAAQ
eukprot:TRINITY_DN11354_c0_g1_i1.p1 TRINITY_DN11354_c0_g1~~TRINITY_DN11354_c0_g1_i1.p1  ORF type:complete len:139 (-),score=19.18 TRINITY_DN11354_c0_g1_i1:63-428(-)